MAHRTFLDRIGMTWEVWDVRPTSQALADRTGSPVLAEGWLCFQSGSTRKRLYPIPLDWESLPESELVRLWRVATPAATRRTARDAVEVIHLGEPE